MGTSVSVLPYTDGVPLQHWALDNDPDDKVLGRRRFWEQIIFVRDDLSKVFCASPADRWDDFVHVVSSHRSKSIDMPVYSITVPNMATVLLCGNFDDWVVSVEAASPVPDNFIDLFERGCNEEPIFCWGFRDDWVFPAYRTSPRRFTLRLYDQNKLYTFCYLLSAGLGLRGNGGQG